GFPLVDQPIPARRGGYDKGFGVPYPLLPPWGTYQHGTTFHQTQQVRMTRCPQGLFRSKLKTLYSVKMNRMRGELPQPPVGSLIQYPGFGQELLLHARPFPAEVEVFKRPLNIQGPRVPVQVHPLPVIHLKCINIRRTADLQNQVVHSRTLNRSI